MDLTAGNALTAAGAAFRTADVQLAPGAVVRVRELSARDGIEFARLSRLAAEAAKTFGADHETHALANLDMLQHVAMACAVDENGARLMTGETGRFSCDNLSVEVLSSIFSAVIELSYGDDDDAGGDVGNVA